MDYLIFSRWFSLVSLLLSLGILFNLEDAREMAKNMVRTETGYIMGGVLPIIFGSLSLVFINSFDLGWNMVVTVVGGAMLAVGIFRVLFVRQWKALMSRHIDKIPFLFSLFGLMAAVILFYAGFIASMFEFSIN
jgi:uncharacterized membrane protein